MDVTPETPEYPISHQLIRERERHDYQPYRKVRDGEGRYEPVLNILEGLLRHDRNDDKHVPNDHNNHENNHENAGDDDVRQRIPARIKRVEADIRVVEKGIVERHVVEEGIVEEGTVARVFVEVGKDVGGSVGQTACLGGGFERPSVVEESHDVTQLVSVNCCQQPLGRDETG